MYKSDFAKAAGLKYWSLTKTTQSPSGQVLLTPGWALRFTQDQLPEHQFLRVRIKLAIIGPHDGADPEKGPDHWSLSIEHGTVLIHTNFRNPGKDRRGPADLSAKEFQTRVAARAEMKKLHLEALPILEKKLASGPVAEVRASLTSIIKFLRARTKSTHGEAGHRRLVAARAAQVLRILRIPESGRRYSASSSDSPLASLDDGWVPALMKGNVVPRFDWWNPHGKDVWVQLEYPQAKTFASAEVFWFENKTWDKGAKLPASWSLSFLHGDVWKPVKAKGNYSITHEKFDRVEFEPVTTRAIRLNAKGSATNRAALVEFRLGEKEPAEKKPAVDAPEPATDE